MLITVINRMRKGTAFSFEVSDWVNHTICSCRCRRQTHHRFTDDPMISIHRWTASYIVGLSLDAPDARTMGMAWAKCVFGKVNMVAARQRTEIGIDTFYYYYGYWACQRAREL